MRRLLASPWVPAVVVFAVVSIALPRPIAAVTTHHFESEEHARMFIAVKGGPNGFSLYPMGAPSTLEKAQEPFLGDAVHATGTEFESVHVVRRDATAVLMETVRADGIAELTCRYQVNGRRVTPIAQMSYGPIDKVLAGLIGLVAAVVCKLLVARHRFATDRRAV